MSLVAIVPVAQMAAANTALQTAGFGPRNFSVAAFGATGASHAALHAWNDAAFAPAVKALPGVVWDESDGDPITLTADLIADQNVRWGAQAPPLPTEGPIATGDLYSEGGLLWYVITGFDRTTFPLPPVTYPALLARFAPPGQVVDWWQPLTQFDAPKLLNPFTGLPDRRKHLGQTWVVTQADGAGNNVWEPGVFGWTVAP